MDRESEMSRCKLRYTGRINSKVPAHNTGLHILYPVIGHSGGEREKEGMYCLCTTESFG